MNNHNEPDINLLPCPFCGASVVMGKNREGSKIPYFQVECGECGALAGGGYDTIEGAVKNWNRRPILKQLTGDLNEKHFN